MPIDFPNTPTNGDSYSAGGKTWVYNGSASAWALFGLPTAIANGSVGTGQMADGSVTLAKLHSEVMSTIDNMDDVDLTVAPEEGHFLRYSSSASVWVSASAASGGGGLDTESDGAIIMMDIGA
jgi:hypothetical protein